MMSIYVQRDTIGSEFLLKATSKAVSARYVRHDIFFEEMWPFADDCHQSARLVRLVYQGHVASVAFCQCYGVGDIACGFMHNSLTE